MEYKPVADFLSRSLSTKSLELGTYYAKRIDNIIDFGTHILKWEIEASENGDMNIIRTLLFRSLIQISDSISTTLKAFQDDCSGILLRSFFENFLYFEYLIEDNQLERTQSFLVWRAKQDIKRWKKSILDYPSGKEFLLKMKKDKRQLNSSKFFDNQYVIEALKEKELLLDSDQFIKTNKEYERIKGLGNKNPSWFSLYNGPRNIEDLANYLNRTIDYELIYRKYSENTHILNLTSGIDKIEPNFGLLRSLRKHDGLEEIFHCTQSYLLSAIENYTRIFPEKNLQIRNWLINYEVN